MAAVFCDEDEIKALSSMFKGNSTAAEAFCAKLGHRITGDEEGMNTFFLTIMGAMVFIMHAGFAMVSSSSTSTSCLDHWAPAGCAVLCCGALLVGVSLHSRAFQAPVPHLLRIG